MGILNCTPDSFFDGGKYTGVDAAIAHAKSMINEGAHVIDVGGASSRPGAKEVSSQEELKRVLPVINELKDLPVYLSIDTNKAEVADAAVAAGAHIVNDISAGDDDPEMIATVAQHNVPFIAMHKQGSAATMQKAPHYENVVSEVFAYLLKKRNECYAAGITDVIIDPGFGFGKTLDHNYELLRNVSHFKQLDCPLLIGISRKSMIYKALNIEAQDALNGTTFLHYPALQAGANILRVHDVKEAVQAIQLYQRLT